jgi:hypothetical protein
MKTKNELVKLESMNEMTTFAKTLKNFIVRQGLFSNIKGKNYVNVEGWEFAGAMTGIAPMVKSVVREDTEQAEIKYRAEVELINSQGIMVGWGMAVCSNKEASKRMFDEYAIASMAQTRAIGKAYRNKMAFLMKMAGYEPTPAEEVTEKTVEKEIKEEDLNKPATENQIEAIKNLGGLATEGMTKLDAQEYIKKLGAK